jgi:hypothetical protein
MYPYYPTATGQYDTTAYPGMYSSFVSGGVQVTSSIATTTKQTDSSSLSSFNATAYLTAAAYIAQQKQQQAKASKKVTTTSNTPNTKPWWWSNKSKKMTGPKDTTQYYCETCKISCGGVQAWKMHLDGQKHKKKTAQKASTNTGPATKGTLRCDLCDISVVGAHAFNAHIKGVKHNKALRLFQRLGKPIPEVVIPVQVSHKTVPLVSSKLPQAKTLFEGGTTLHTTGSASDQEEAEKRLESVLSNIEVQLPEASQEAVGEEYVKAVPVSEKLPRGGFECSLCECVFNDEMAKKLHVRGRRHKLMYKQKVKPDLKVDMQPSKARQKAMQQKRNADKQQKRQERWQRLQEARKAAHIDRQRARQPLRPHPHPRMMQPPPPYSRFPLPGPPFGPPPPQPFYTHPGYYGPDPPPHHRPPVDYMEQYNEPYYGEGWSGGDWQQHEWGMDEIGFTDDAMMLEQVAVDPTDELVEIKHNEIYPSDDEIYAIQSIVNDLEIAMMKVSDKLTPYIGLGLP